MGDKTDISWADHTFNGWIGCTKVSPACKFCYAERDWDKRFHRVKWGPGGPRSLTKNWRSPLLWNADAAARGVIETVFAFSLADNMDDHPSILPEWRERFFHELVIPTTNLEWLLLTKRPENWDRFLPGGLKGVLPNVRLGVSIEDQDRADERGPLLAMAHHRGWKTFVSYGPACGLVDWDPLMMSIDWLVSEGESGPNARPSPPELFRQARDACYRHRVPYHHKQNGEWCEPGSARVTVDKNTVFRSGRPTMFRVGVEKSGRLLDGMLHDAFPVRK